MTLQVAVINGKAPSGGVGGVSDADLSQAITDLFSTGVAASTHAKVEQQTTPNMTVKVALGNVYVRNSAATNTFIARVTAIENPTITNNASGNPRIDAVVVKVDIGATPNNQATNVASIAVVAGTPAASPVAPTDSAIQTAVGAGNPFYRLANVTVANGAVSITDANIADTRSVVALSAATSGINDGWTSDSATWTYASATTFTVSGDKTAQFQKGTRLKLTQSAAVKYFVVVGSSHGGGTTTVTITGGTDYSLANATISATFYSYQASPQGFPDWFNYTPTWGGFSVAPSLTLARFRVIGSTCMIALAASYGTSNATNLTISLPVNALLQQYAVCLAANQGAYKPVAMETVAGSGTLTVYSDGGFAAFTASGNKVAQISGFTYQI